MNRTGKWLVLGVLAAGGALAGCGDGAGDEAERPGSDAAPAVQTSDADLGPEELENGIGPVREVELGALDAVLAERGEDRFRTLCYACHRLEERYVAPKLGDVLERRTPEYVMNMILNPLEMTQRHPEARALLGEFMTQMPDQGLTEEDARSIVEYIRAEAESGAAEGTDPNARTGG
jgi:cytochrome c